MKASPTPKASVAAAKTGASTTTAKTNVRLHGWKLWVGALLLLVGGLSLFMGQSAVWISNTVFNQKTFVETTGKVLSTEESRSDIATIIVDQAFADRPVVKRIVGSKATSLLTGLLGSDLVANVYSRVSNGAYAYVTSPNQQDVTIDLTSIKTPLSGIVSFAENRGSEVTFDPSQIPDQIVLLDADDVPDLSGYIQSVLILNALFWIIASAAFITFIFIKKDGRVRRIYFVLVTVATVAIIGLFSGPFVPPVIASFVSLIQARDIITALSQAFLAPFLAQMWTMLIITALVTLVLSLRHHAQRGAQSLIALLDGKRK